MDDFHYNPIEPSKMWQKKFIGASSDAIARQYDRMWNKRPDPSRDEFYRQRIVDLCHRIVSHRITNPDFKSINWNHLQQQVKKSHNYSTGSDLYQLLYAALTYRNLDKIFDFQEHNKKIAGQLSRVTSVYMELWEDENWWERLQECKIMPTRDGWMTFGRYEERKDETKLRAYLTLDPDSFSWDKICKFVNWVYDNLWLSGKFTKDPKGLVERHEGIIMYGPDLDLDDFVEAVEETAEFLEDECDLSLLSHPTPIYFAPEPKQYFGRRQESFHMRLSGITERIILKIMRREPSKYRFKRKVSSAFLSEGGVFTKYLVKENLAL